MKMPLTFKGCRRLGPRIPNTWEAAYAATILEPRRVGGEILAWWYEAISLKLAHRTRYTPDFLVMASDGTLECHEIKGFMRESAAVRLKTAAELYPFRFFLVTRKRIARGQMAWVTKEVNGGEK